MLLLPSESSCSFSLTGDHVIPCNATHIQPCQKPCQPLSQLSQAFLPSHHLSRPTTMCRQDLGKRILGKSLNGLNCSKLRKQPERPKCWSGSPATSRLVEMGVSCPMCDARGKPGDLPGSQQTVLTCQHPGSVLGNPREGPLSLQDDLCRFQMSHFDLESPAEGSQLSWQMIDFEHLLLARCKETLQGQERRKGLHQSFDVGWLTGQTG